MRLTGEQAATVRSATAEVGREDARVKDDRRGDGIDRLIECAWSVASRVFSASRIAVCVQRGMHGRKVDVRLLASDLLRLPLQDMAKSQRIRL